MTMARRKINPEEPADAPSFEQALEGLEAVVEAMENERLPLEELVACYEKGSALLDRCEQILQAARGRIKLITLRHQSGTTSDAENGAPDQLCPPSGTPDAPDDDDDIRLF
jgi:exodeoxyribonuclease VII small subunit